MLERVISGGQTGVDQAGWRAARACGIPTGGSMPLGFLTEEGPRPDFAEAYGAVELATGDYPIRTRANTRDSDVTLWFGDTASIGGQTTLRACAALARPVLLVNDVAIPSEVAAWLEARGVRVLNIAGNRETTTPGIGAGVERFLVEGFRVRDDVVVDLG